MITKKYNIMIIAVLIIAATITTTSVYAASLKSLCSNYGGDWSNGKCKGLSGEDKADYEDAVCDYPEDSAKYRKICG
jgi:hypothetical protein